MSNPINKVSRRVKAEQFYRSLTKKGYERAAAKKWYKLMQQDKAECSRETREKLHQLGYLAKTADKIENLADSGRVTDLDYLSLRPMNNQFAKWIEDINTMTRILPQYAHRLPKIYFSISNRDGLKILDFPSANRELTAEDVCKLIKESGKTYHLRPAFWNSPRAKYELDLYDERLIRYENCYVDREQFEMRLQGIMSNYLLTELLTYDYCLEPGWDKKAYYKFYFINEGEQSRIASAIAVVHTQEEDEEREEQFLLDLENGSFTDAEGAVHTLPDWQTIRTDLLGMAGAMPQLRYFSLSIVLTEDGFKVNNANHTPVLPEIPFHEDLNTYLKNWAAFKKTQDHGKYFTPERFAMRKFKKHVEEDCRPGIRPYMQKLWEDAVASDKKWKGTTPEQKKWAWERGFLSFRIGQYNLTEENYRDMLSDYDYHWLNRINNVYQAWISDKTTFRYTMQPMKQFIPDYYFSVFKQDDKAVIVRMQDCPAEIGEGVKGICDIIRRDSIIVFKPSAGLHGDGFYCLEYRDNSFFINGEATDEKGIENLINAQRSNYVVTSYIVMNSILKQIYPKSVNSIRMMVINRHGHDPKIMQTYMRIGSSKTGYTDNVGYGGICAMIDIETGELYDPETLVDHIYYPCPNHPDTGTQIAGIRIPRWDSIKESVVEISRLFPELEYLGFDVAVTEDSFNIMEINVHQDLHKVALHTDEIRAYYRDRIEYKSKMYQLDQLKYWY